VEYRFLGYIQNVAADTGNNKRPEITTGPYEAITRHIIGVQNFRVYLSNQPSYLGDAEDVTQIRGKGYRRPNIMENNSLYFPPAEGYEMNVMALLGKIPHPHPYKHTASVS